MEPWLKSFDSIPGFNSFLYDNTLLGTLVADQRYVYAINDLAVPPHPALFYGQNQFNPAIKDFTPGELKPFMVQNELIAYDLVNGKMNWDLNHDDVIFRDSHFVSLPISIGGKLYVLNERVIDPAPPANQFGQPINAFGGESELRLVCIDPTKLQEKNTTSPKPTIVGAPVVLANVLVPNRFVQDISRRVNAVQLAYSDGVLVCPTNAGEMFGIDLLTRTLVWSYSYREQMAQQFWLPGIPMGFPPQPAMAKTTTVISKWKSSPPAIQDGKIVFTAPDADSIHCVNLRDGKPLWMKAQQKGDLYLAGVFDGRVLVVSDKNVRALDLKTGAQVWSIPTGDLPSGQGVASKGIYYLPLAKEILAVDIVKGEVKAHNRVAAGGTSPGNLVFYENMVLSQTPTEVMAFPQIAAMINDAKLDFFKDPTNLAKVTEYGDLLLKDGQIRGGVQVLVKVHELKPRDPLGKRVKDLLFAGLTDLMHRDFDKAGMDYLAVYEALCTVPGDAQEEQRRKATFFRLVGQGREAQGKLVEAFQMYQDFGALPLHVEQGGVPSSDDPGQKIPVNIWLRGRVSGMLARATPEERRRWKRRLPSSGKWSKGRRTATRSATSPACSAPVSKSAEKPAWRWRLASWKTTRSPSSSRPSCFCFKCSRATMARSRSPRAGPLPRWRNSRNGAAPCRRCGKRRAITSNSPAISPKYRCAARRTGAELLDELAADKRFQAFLSETGDDNVFGSGKLTARDTPKTDHNVNLLGFVMMRDGDPTHFDKHYRLTVDSSNPVTPTVRLRNRSNGLDRWTMKLDNVPMNQQVFFTMYQQTPVNQHYNPNAAHCFYHGKGNLIVCQIGVMVYAFDGSSGKKLWEWQTVDNVPQNAFIQFQQILTDSEGNAEIRYINVQTGQPFSVPIGRVGTAQASYVAVLGHKGLRVVDPLSGALLWQKPDIAIQANVFGDDQYLFVIEPNGVGRAFRASDGEAVKAVDFSAIHQARLHTLGRRILAAQTGDANVTLRLYDILSGKDVWSKAFPLGAHVLKTEERNIAGVVEPNGMLTVLEVNTGKTLVSTSLEKGRITAADFKTLLEPLLLQDSERFYVALNQPIDDKKVAGKLIHTNLQDGTRGLPVNGWFVAVHRNDGKKKAVARELSWKKGDVAWHSYTRVENQLLLLEAFEQSPILLFSARVNEWQKIGGSRWMSATQSLHKTNGKSLYESTRSNHTNPQFLTLQIDLGTRTVNLLGFGGSVQHYLDTGKGPPP